LAAIGLGSNNLTGWDFSTQNLRSASFTHANLSGADFTGANLTEANLWAADLSNATLAGAELKERWWTVLFSPPRPAGGYRRAALQHGYLPKRRSERHGSGAATTLPAGTPGKGPFGR